MTPRLALARAEWEAGERRLERARRDPRRVDVLDDVVDAIRLGLTARVGQTYTMAELLDAYDDSSTWARDIAQRVAPGQAWAHDATLVADPVFARAARGAVDWSP